MDIIMFGVKKRMREIALQVFEENINTNETEKHFKKMLDFNKDNKEVKEKLDELNKIATGDKYTITVYYTDNAYSLNPMYTNILNTKKPPRLTKTEMLDLILGMKTKEDNKTNDTTKHPKVKPSKKAG